MHPGLTTVVATISKEPERSVLCFGPDAHCIVDGASDAHGGEVRVLDFSGAVLAAYQVPGRPIKARLNADASAMLVLLTMAMGDRHALLLLLDLAAGTLKPEGPDLDVPGAIEDLAWLPDGSAFVVGQGHGGGFAVARRLGQEWLAVDLPPLEGALREMRCASGSLFVQSKARCSPLVCYRTSIFSVTMGYPFPEISSWPLISITDLAVERYNFSEDGRHLVGFSQPTLWSAGPPPRKSRIPGPPLMRRQAFGRDCLVGLQLGEPVALVWRLTADGPVSWGEGWPVEESADVSVEEGHAGTYVAILLPDRTDIFRLTDHDILDSYQDDDRRRLAAVGRLGERRLADAVPHLERLLGAASQTDIPTVAQALGAIGTTDAVDVLCAMLRSDRPRSRVAAASALADRTDPAALPALLSAVADPDPETARHAWSAVLAGLPIGPAARAKDPPEMLEETVVFAAEVSRSGRTQTARAAAPEGARVLDAIADGLVTSEQSADRVLNALTDLGSTERCRPVATAIGLLAAEQLLQRNDTDKAISYLTRVADHASTTGAAEVEWRARGAIGDALAGARRWRQADEYYTAAEAIIDRMWAALLGDLDDRHFFADKADLYDQAMLCRLRLGRVSSALDTLERSKTRFLGDLIARRHAQPQEGLEQVDKEFWYASGERRPVNVSRTSGTASASELEIVDVDLDVPTGPEGVVPAALAALVDSGHPDSVTMALDLWSVVAMVHRGGFPAVVEDSARDALSQVDAALLGMRAAADDDTDEAHAAQEVRRYLEAARKLSDLRWDSSVGAWHSSEDWPGGALQEFRGWEEAYVRGDPKEAPLVNALAEAAGFASGRRYIRAMESAGSVIRAAGAGGPDRPLPVFSAAEPTNTSAADGEVHPTATSALSMGTISRWRYVRQIARGETVGVEEAARLLAVRPNTALLQFALTRFGTVIYVMTSGADLDAEPLPNLQGWTEPTAFTVPGVTSREVEERIYGSSGWMERYEQRKTRLLAWQEATDQLLEWLHGTLFEPLHGWLTDRGIRRLLVIPHRGLHLLPMSAWFTRVRGKRLYIGDAFDVSFAPSLTLLDICRQRIDDGGRADTGPRSALALLDPTSDLPFTRLDALAVRPVPTANRIFTGPHATTAHWIEHGPSADPCHYAGHAVYRRPDPLGSSIELGTGKVTLGDIFDDGVPVASGASLVLSGCETAMTDYGDAADEHLGLASGFLFAGSSSVLSTNWAVAEAPAALLIDHYYANLQQMEPAAALAEAQRKLRHSSRRDMVRLLDRVDVLDREGVLDKRSRDRLRHERESLRQGRADYSHPIYWAAYTVTGLHGFEASRNLIDE
jgi:CHAT domain-containing protein/tetratricopeptide (TPR) repeat protein